MSGHEPDCDCEACTEFEFAEAYHEAEYARRVLARTYTSVPDSRWGEPGVWYSQAHADALEQLVDAARAVAHAPLMAARIDALREAIVRLDGKGVA